MAPKRLLEDPPPAASSSTEEEEGSEDDATDEERENGVSEGLEDEEHEADHQSETPTSNKSTVTALSKALQRKSSSGSDDESGSETESESDKFPRSPSASDFTIKPIVSGPKEAPGKPQKNAAKRELTLALAATVTGGNKGTSKRDVVGKEPKKNKSSNAQDGDSKKGSCIQRIWSEDDEIEILKGMIEYQSKKGADPCAEMEAFYGFIKKNFSADVSKNQLMGKIKRLKKKYQTLAEKGENGEDPFLAKPRDHKFFELAKAIWGAVVTNGVHGSAKKKKKSTQEEVKTSALALPNVEINEAPASSTDGVHGSAKKKKKSTQEEVKTSALALPNVEINEAPASSNSSFFDVLLPGKFLPLPKAATSLMKEALPLIGSTRITELESRWRKLQEDECELYLNKVKLVHDYAKVMLESMKSSMY